MQSEYSWVIEQPEGQFLERKSCYDRTKGGLEPRSIKDVIRDVAEVLIAMANADGGTLALGLEDDGDVSGIPDQYHRGRFQRQLKDYIGSGHRFGAAAESEEWNESYP